MSKRKALNLLEEKLSKSSVKYRFLISFFGNLCRGALAFVSVIVVARGLGPNQFGDLTFLLSSFAIVRALLEMGTSSAFFTLLSRRQRNFQFVLSYFVFQFFLYSLPVLIVAWFFPEGWIHFIWFGASQSSLLLGFTAIFLQTQIWLAIIHIGESQRLTKRVHILNILVAATHLFFILIAWQTIGLNIELIFGLTILEYLIFFPIAFKVLSISEMERGNLDGRSIVKEYRDYCLPIVPLTLVLFISNIADRWLLQYFGGSKEQAFYSIGLQFSTVCLVLVSSMSRIFWKEISEALENKDRDRVKILYQKTCRFFFTSTTVICCFIIPWSRDITEVFLGPSYIDGSGVLAIMLLSPIYMSLLQILTIILLASGKTKSYSIIQCISTSFSIPIAYFIQASPNSKVPGLDLGAYGIAWKGILFSMIITNIIAWLLSREYEWKFDWLYQVVGLILFLFLGWFSFNVVSALSSLVPLHLVAKVSITFLLYSTISTIIVWAMPWLVGMTRAEFELNISFGLIPNRKK